MEFKKNVICPQDALCSQVNNTEGKPQAGYTEPSYDRSLSYPRIFQCAQKETFARIAKSRDIRISRRYLVALSSQGLSPERIAEVTGLPIAE
uniref:Uncharacterized protein n=1 Tax=Candidatus Kentrum sp. UNK TaxID=2126344 RepID=A0A451B1B5_9GAMM|nr:MAG: hypothetical protein BECKUNK1418G_GA0071005_109810 [Candidatus Kentron sp. UNK]VFK72083.1 MAG: hypothetical protein BECKUNK1418H_GA0071006_109510 [Candidatus Kentron sp. UNK]